MSDAKTISFLIIYVLIIKLIAFIPVNRFGILYTVSTSLKYYGRVAVYIVPTLKVTDSFSKQNPASSDSTQSTF